MGRARGSVRGLIRQTARSGRRLLVGLMLVAALLPTATPALAQACGGFTFGPPISLPNGGAAPLAPLVADLNGDGLPDLALVNNDSDNIAVLFALSSPGSFNPPLTFPTGGQFPVALAVADLNEDFLADLIAANYASDTGEKDISVLLGTPTPDFFATPTFVSTGDGAATSVVVADFDGDTHLDLAVATD